MESCAIESTGSVCNHIDRYYPNKFETVPIFWVIEFDWLSREIVEATFKHSIEGTEDQCHYLLENLTKSSSRRIFKNAQNNNPEQFFKCENGELVNVSLDELVDVIVQ